jgi:Spy/CpxP family protein refolding chaperone
MNDYIKGVTAMVKSLSTSLLKRSTLYICAITVAVSSFFAAQNSTAGGGDRHGKRANVEQRVEHLNKKLNLTEQQKQQITVIFREVEKQAPQHDKDATREERRAQMEAWRAQREKVDSQIVAVLTPEQKATYEKMQAERKEKMKETMEKRKEKKDNQG